MAGLPALPVQYAVPLRVALRIAADVLGTARWELGEVDGDVSRQQWALALEGLQERIEHVRRLVSAE